MVARVLVVDDVLANVKLLEARLSAEYFEVITAHNGMQALDLLQSERIDLVLLDVMMPGMDGFEVCARIKGAPDTMHIPVIMVTALDQPSDKVQGLDAGADDFLTKPIDDVALITRVKNLARLKALNDEMRMRVASGAELGILHSAFAAWSKSETPGRILLVEDQPHVIERISKTLAGVHAVDVETAAQPAVLRLVSKPYDLLIASLSLASSDGLRLCSQVRSLQATRHLPIIMIVEPGEDARLLRGLDMGVNDYVTRPVDRNELSARVRTQIRRKRHSDHLRDRLAESVELAIIDPLTGLHNRRYMETHLKLAAEQARTTRRPLTLLLADIDNFKIINDTHGHAAGDCVLREFAGRLRQNSRAVDLTCRMGGEEFVIIMPDTGLEWACQIGERLRASIAAEPFQAGVGASLRVTASVGIAAWAGENDSLDLLFKRADGALYSAKKDGRNRVVADAA
jgi:two-component system, cell cycle response regulator